MNGYHMSYTALELKHNFDDDSWRITIVFGLLIFPKGDTCSKHLQTVVDLPWVHPKHMTFEMLLHMA